MAFHAEEAEAQAMKWWEVLQAKRKNHEREARSEARLLEEAESQAEQTKQLKEQAEARALQNEQMKELEAHIEARSKAEQLKDRMREFETHTEAQATEKAEAHAMKQLGEQAEA